MRPLSYIALTGSLGAGFKESSLERGLSRPLDFIAADSGSTDGGPYYLGTGEWIWARQAYKRDLQLGLLGAHRAGVPLIIGSCGGGGGDDAVDGYVELVQEIVREAGIGVRVATVHCEPDRRWLADKYRAGDLLELRGAPAIDESTFAQPGHIVAMAGAEPIQESLDAGADVILAGRTSDAALYAAMPLSRGFDPGPVWNAAKIAECGSAAAENRSGQDCLACTFDDEGFILEPLDPALRCTPRSVAAHTLYETADPYRLVQPSGTLDAREARYVALDERRVRVVGGSFEPATQYTAKLEGAAPVGFLSSFWGSTRDPVILSQLDTWIASLTSHTRDLGLEAAVYYLGMGLIVLKPGAAEEMQLGSFPSVAEMLRKTMDMGITVYVCEASKQMLGWETVELIEGVKIVGAATLNDLALDADAVMWF